MPMLKIYGASLFDETFTLMRPDWPEISWNATRLERDAFAGRFGEPQELQFASLDDYPIGFDPWQNLDREKVYRMMREADTLVERNGKQYKLIDLPGISVGLIRDKRINAFPVDGNHRMMARMELKLPSYSRFIVMPDIEQDYRVTYVET